MPVEIHSIFMAPHESLIEITLASLRADVITPEILKDIFFQLGFSPQQVAECSRGGKAQVSVYLHNRDKARRIRQRILALHLRHVKVMAQNLRPRQWRDRWKKEIQPFVLTKNFDVVPVWCRQGYQQGRRRPIFIDTTLAFGTGLHETTQFMARLIERAEGKFVSFLDVGTGTGLLAIVAEHCGARRILALDIDRNSVAAAKKNFLLNRTRRVKIVHRDFMRYRPVAPFDFVAANLFTEDLIAFRQKLVDSVNPGGWLALSGISLNHLPKLKRAFKSLPLRCRKIMRGKKWTAVFYQKEGRGT